MSNLNEMDHPRDGEYLYNHGTAVLLDSRAAIMNSIKVLNAWEMVDSI